MVEIKKCSKCGKTYDNSWAVCISCGERLEIINVEIEKKDAIELVRKRRLRRLDRKNAVEKKFRILAGFISMVVARELTQTVWGACPQKAVIGEAIKEWKDMGVEIENVPKEYIPKISNKIKEGIEVSYFTFVGLVAFEEGYFVEEGLSKEETKTRWTKEFSEIIKRAKEDKRGWAFVD